MRGPPGRHRLCDRWSSGGPAEETAEWMAATRARSASQPGAGADSSTPNPGKPFGTRSPLYGCWPHRLSTSEGNDAGVLRKLGPQKPKAATGRNSFPPLVLRCSSGLSQPLTRAGRAVFVSGKATVHRRRAAFSLSVFPIWSGAVVPEHLRSPGGLGHIGPIAFVKTRSLLEFCLVHVQDEALLVLVHPEQAPRHREQLVSHAQNSAEGQHRVGYPTGWDVDHDLVEFAKVFARRVPHAVSSQCARRQDAPILFVGICLLDLALHRNDAPYTSGALHL